ncbi:hypothetical protein [Phormidesmis priestleyi]
MTEDSQTAIDLDAIPRRAGDNRDEIVSEVILELFKTLSLDRAAALLEELREPINDNDYESDE